MQDCIACGASIQTSSWDRWNGFLVACPACRHWSGERWSAKSVLLGSVFLNALSYFVTMRPRRAACAVGATALLILPAVLYPDAKPPDWLMIGWLGLLMFTPLLVNAGLLLRHLSLLGRPIPPRGDAPGRTANEPS